MKTTFNLSNNIINILSYHLTGSIPQIHDSQGSYQVGAHDPQAGDGGEAFREQCGGGDHDSWIHVPHVHSGTAGRGYQRHTLSICSS